MHFHFMLLLFTDMPKIIEILLRLRAGLILHSQYHGC